VPLAQCFNLFGNFGRNETLGTHPPTSVVFNPIFCFSQSTAHERTGYPTTGRGRRKIMYVLTTLYGSKPWHLNV
jgi:hypothetical protein